MFRTCYRWIALSAPIPSSNASPSAVYMVSASRRFCSWWALGSSGRPMRSGSTANKFVKNEMKNQTGCNLPGSLEHL
ncbi:MAG: hypothetical protein CM15mP103_09280 [Gammaproteobacteria bacterium]|nr:MAG: hypothetical protein CM15mP103_09280 [Gammaproteobacteria bacterium]